MAIWTYHVLGTIKVSAHCDKDAFAAASDAVLDVLNDARLTLVSEELHAEDTES